MCGGKIIALNRSQTLPPMSIDLRHSLITTSLSIFDKLKNANFIKTLQPQARVRHGRRDVNEMRKTFFTSLALLQLALGPNSRATRLFRYQLARARATKAGQQNFASPVAGPGRKLHSNTWRMTEEAKNCLL